MTKIISETAAIEVPKSKSVKSSEQPALARAAKPDATTPTPRSPRKQHLLDMLGRENGASSAEMIAATGWLPHTLRAALSGLRKQGHYISRIKDEDGNSRYQLTVPAAKPALRSSRKISTAAPQPRKTDRRSSTPKGVER
jgi:hypothetical protein